MSELLFEYTFRLKQNQLSIRNAYGRLELAIENNHDSEIYGSIGELLLWIITTEEWYKEHVGAQYELNRDSDENGLILLGMRHAYNCMKHNMKFFSIHHKEGGFTFPMSFPLDVQPITVVWSVAGEVLVGKYINQKRNYEEYLEGKEIMLTFNKVITFLNKEFQKTIF